MHQPARHADPRRLQRQEPARANVAPGRPDRALRLGGCRVSRSRHRPRPGGRSLLPHRREPRPRHVLRRDPGAVAELRCNGHRAPRNVRRRMARGGGDHVGRAAPRASLGRRFPPESTDVRSGADPRARSLRLAGTAGPAERPPRAAAEGRMRRLRIGFMFRRPYGAGHVSIFPKTMQALADAGVVVDVIAANGRLIDLSTVRVEHDLYVLKQISGISMSLAGALHAQGAAVVNPYPVTVAIRDKVIAARILGAAGAPMPATYVVSQPDLLTPLLNVGPLVVKPYDGTCGLGVRVVRNEAELFAEPRAAHKPPPILAQRYHAPDGRDLKIYVIGERLFGVRKVFPARTEAEKYGEPFTPTAEREPAGGPAGQPGGGRARRPAPRLESGAAPGVGPDPGRPRRRRRRVRAPTGTVPRADREDADPPGLPPRRAPRPARAAARARAGPARRRPRAGALQGSPHGGILRAMGRSHASRADRRGRSAAPVGRRGRGGRDGAVVPPRLHRAGVPLELRRGA